MAKTFPVHACQPRFQTIFQYDSSGMKPVLFIVQCVFSMFDLFEPVLVPKNKQQREKRKGRLFTI